MIQTVLSWQNHLLPIEKHQDGHQQNEKQELFMSASQDAVLSSNQYYSSFLKDFAKTDEEVYKSVACLQKWKKKKAKIYSQDEII